MREKQRLSEINAIRASLDSRSTTKRPLALAPAVAADSTADDEVPSAFDDEMIEEEASNAPSVLLPLLKKTKSTSHGRPTQSLPWSQKTEAADRKELRRLKKAKRVKAVNGVIVRERVEDGEGAMDWKEAIREEKERKRNEKVVGGGNKSGKRIEGMVFEL